LPREKEVCRSPSDEGGGFAKPLWVGTDAP
jgi:hypothetical protein